MEQVTTTDITHIMEQPDQESTTHSTRTEHTILSLSSNMEPLEEVNPSSPLENLPPELRIHILSLIPDLSTLRSLVRASPVMHAQYMHSRNKILSMCFFREMYGAVNVSLELLMHRLGTPFNEYKAVVQRPDGTLAHRPRSNPSAMLTVLNPAHVRIMAAFHLSVMLPKLKERRQRLWREFGHTGRENLKRMFKCASGNFYILEIARVVRT
ncbi:hypothetical protein B0I35DRAFT_411980 [Stachybotrys elegans]|uniref:F-box domain-containing protein n=1 Tax=Stachybotrys elegans TaxID=80388 RepID=A0A8K0SK21_9HYPO|nr:hypothetical protein B0I35DRAFT_411980 [Stachybotrys elegans]